MSPDQWANVKALFNAALERPAEQRDAFVRESCGDDETRTEVERLLAAHGEASGFIERSPVAGVLSDEPSGPLTGRVLDHYQLGPVLGSGGMGVVYVARDLELHRRVALKFVTSDEPDARARLRREAQRASQLNHPNVCTIHQVCASEANTYFVMEYVEGQTLTALIRQKAFGPAESLGIARQIADALAHAHDRGFVHRDLKSANVMVTPEGRVKLLDFGLAMPFTDRVSEVSRSQATLLLDEPIAGTLPYMAPELLRAEPPNAQSDLWALGVVLYEMATGQRPFDGATGLALCAAIQYQDPAPFPPSVPAPVRSAILRLLAKDPRQRHTDARDCASAIDTARDALDGLAARHDRARSGIDGSRPGALPPTRTSFVGRVEELARFAHDLQSHRLVTLTGVGGSGKTRLALRLMEQARDTFRDGVWWIDLAPLTDQTRVDEAVATALGVLNPQRPPRDSVLDFVAARRLLLALDNCEHVLAPAADLVDALLGTAGDVHVLATSREPLGVVGERVEPVPSLSLPSEPGDNDLKSAAESDAVRLFVDRAGAVRPGFSIAGTNCRTILEICRRLDGIPLAIELAAAHARVLSVDQIRERLEDRLTQLSGRGRVVPRHQTLGAALQWSYDLLAPGEQRALRHLSVLQGSWTLSAAAAVCGEPGGSAGMLDVLWRLADKSLVEVVHTDGADARYRLLEMVRQFALERLVAAGEAASARARHVEHYLDCFERLIPQLLGPHERSAVTTLERELDNVLAALSDDARRDGGGERVIRAIADGWLWWVTRGRIARGRDLLAAALRRFPEAEAPTRAHAFSTSAMLARFAGDGACALRDSETSVALYETLSDPDHSGLAFGLFQRATARVNFAQDRLGAGQDLERGADIARRAGDETTRGICLNTLAMLAMGERQMDEAETLLLEALSTGRTAQSPYLQTLYLSNLALVSAGRGRWSQCIALNREVITLVEQSGNRHFAPAAVLNSARILAGAGHLQRAVRLFGAAEAIWSHIGEAPSPEDLTEAEHQLTSCGAPPGREDYAGDRAGGRALGFDEALAEALAALEDCHREARA